MSQKTDKTKDMIGLINNAEQGAEHIITQANEMASKILQESTKNTAKSLEKAHADVLYEREKIMSAASENAARMRAEMAGENAKKLVDIEKIGMQNMDSAVELICKKVVE